MNIEFTKRAFEAHIASAEKAESIGNFSNAASFYKKAVDECKQLASADFANSAIWEAKVTTYENKLSELSSGNVVRAQNTSSAPARAASSAPAAAAKEAGGTDKPASNSDYEGYDFEITKPNNDMRFDDLVGLDKAKREIFDKLVNPMRHPEIYKDKYKMQVGTAMLLYGPGGTGKTSFAKAVANELGYPFIATSGSDIVDKYIGETAKSIKKLFKEVRRFIKENNTPVVLYIDEFDDFAKSADTDDKASASAVPELKRQMDGVDTDNSNLVIIASTNHIELIDKPVKSRMECIEVPLPDRNARRIMIEKKFKKSAIDQADIEKFDIDKLAQGSEGLSGRDISRAFMKLLSRLAERDAGLGTIDQPLNDLLLELFSEYQGKNE